MNKARLHLFGTTLCTIGFPILFNISLSNVSALGATLARSECKDYLSPTECTNFLEINDKINFDVMFKNIPIGQIGIKVLATGGGSRGLTGDFTATGRTITQLEEYLKQETKSSYLKLNWLQIATETGYGLPLVGNTFVDPPMGGIGEQWADNKPWYYDESRPNSLPPGKEQDLRLLLSNNIEGSKLKFDDPPTGPANNKVKFETFLIADFGNNTYDTLRGFSWEVAYLEGEPFIENNRPGNKPGIRDANEPYKDRDNNERWAIGENFQDLNNDGFWTLNEPFTDTNDNNYLDGTTQVISLSSEAVFTREHALLVQRFGGYINPNFGGYTKVLKLPTYEFSESLSPGEVDSFTKSGLQPKTPFLAWTDNLSEVNPPDKPDTVLGVFNEYGQQIDRSDDGGPLGYNKASGLLGAVKPDGTSDFKVTGNNDRDFDGKKDFTKTLHCQTGNYKLQVKLYDTNLPSGIYGGGSDRCPSPPPCNGASGGGGCELNLLRLRNANPNYSSLESVPEPAFIFGFLVLAISRVFHVCKSDKNKKQKASGE